MALGRETDRGEKTARGTNHVTNFLGSRFANREILLGVSGSIAAYKAAELARLFIKEGAKVQVVMTKHAMEFITPLTFFSLTGREVYHDMFRGGPEVATAHIELARRADLVVVAPATATTIARIARGLAEDLLSTTIIASDTPVVIAPAMNPQMYAHPGVRDNVQTLSRWPNYHIAPPTEGELACGEYGLGRLTEPEELLAFCHRVLLGGKQDLKGEHILITAGPTFEDIDPVRFLSNRSTGKMGWAVAHAAARRGAEVTMISSLSPPAPIPGCHHVSVRSARDMHAAVHAHLAPATVLVMSAAVADYRPAQMSQQKIKKGDGDLSLTLVRNPDILASIPPTEHRLHIGFAAETERVLQHASDKLQRKHLDMIVANDVTQPDSGFAVDTNRVSFLYPDGNLETLPLLSKLDVAERICDQIPRLRVLRSNAAT